MLKSIWRMLFLKTKQKANDADPPIGEWFEQEVNIYSKRIGKFVIKTEINESNSPINIVLPNDEKAAVAAIREIFAQLRQTPPELPEPDIKQNLTHSQNSKPK